MCEAHCQTAHRAQMKSADSREGIDVQSRTHPRLRSVICCWRDCCLFADNGRHHKLTSWARELASSRVSLPYWFELGNALKLVLVQVRLGQSNTLSIEFVLEIRSDIH